MIGYVTTIPKVDNSVSLSDPQPITVTTLPCLVWKSCVAQWAHTQLAPKFEPQQVGNIRSCSTSHCQISFLDYIHQSLEKNFNLQNFYRIPQSPRPRRPYDAHLQTVLPRLQGVPPPLGGRLRQRATTICLLPGNYLHPLTSHLGCTPGHKNWTSCLPCHHQ